MLLAILIPNTVRLRFQLCREEREGERVLGFICQLFGSMGLFCEGVAGMYPSPLSLSLPPLSSPLLSPPPAPLAALRPLLLWLPSREQQGAVRGLVCEGRSRSLLSLSAVERNRTVEGGWAPHLISRAYWDKHTEQWNLKKRCVKTRVSKTVLQCNQEGTLNYGARGFFVCFCFVPVSINRIIFSIFIQLLLVSSSLPDCFSLSPWI